MTGRSAWDRLSGVADTGLYYRAWAHSDATIAALPLDGIGRVPHWPRERAEVTLLQILAHMIAETHRHAGQADIVRELVDGAVGRQPDNDNMDSDSDDPSSGRATASGWSRWPARPARAEVPRRRRRHPSRMSCSPPWRPWTSS